MHTNSIDDINFSPLFNTNKISVGRFNLNFWLATGIVTAVLILIIAIFNLQASVDYSLIIFFIVSIVLSRVIRKKQKKSFEKFATSNGWAYTTPETVLNVLPPSFVNLGHSQETLGYVNGTIGKVPFIAYEYTYTIGHGKYSRTYSTTIIATITKKQLPNILLNSQKNQGGLRNFSFFSFNNKYHEINTEGNFQDYYKVYIGNGSSPDALTVITPDVMALLADELLKFDIELHDHTIFLVGDENLINHKDLPIMFQKLLTLKSELDGNAPFSQGWAHEPTGAPLVIKKDITHAKALLIFAITSFTILGIFILFLYLTLSAKPN